MRIGDMVKVLPPFSVSFPGLYEVLYVDEEHTFVLLDGIESAFDFIYVEKKE